MSLLEQQNFLARLFTDENLRYSFWENPQKIGKDYDLTEEDVFQIEEIISDDLNFFANSLFHKRLHEVEKLLPLTKKALADNFAKNFKEFSQIFQPQSVKKHLEDAIEFCKYLQKQSIEPQFAKDSAKFEQTKHEFFTKQKLFSLCILKHNVFSLKKKVFLAVWYRIGNQTRHFIL